jgi:hypothetical protein
VASVLTPSLGTVQEWMTTAAVTIIRMNEFIGNVVLLSVSSRRNSFFSWLS